LKIVWKDGWKRIGCWCSRLLEMNLGKS